jgi:surface antigen
MSIKITAVLLAALIVTSCQNGGSPQNWQNWLGGTGSTVGTLGGAAAGGLIGSQFGSSSGKVLTTVGGTLAGGYLGHLVGAKFDEQDKKQAASAEARAVSTNKSTSWKNSKTGDAGKVHVDRTFTDDSGRECREYTHTVSVTGQEPQTAKGTACRNADGAWELVSG